MKTWQIRTRNLSLDKPLIMGILNLTPDSFSDGGKFLDPEAALKQALRLEMDGADILDLGAESTRPGADAISADEQLRRILPVLEKIRGQVKIPVSIDTTLPEVADACLKAGAEIVNDVSGLIEGGEKMAAIVKKYNAGLVIMHRRGNAKTMQSLAQYYDVVTEVKTELKAQIDLAVASGIQRERIAIDPGIGFAKTKEQSLEILARIAEFQDWGFPVLIGISRKSFLGGSLAERDAATAAYTADLAARGIQIHRVHNVSAAKNAMEKNCAKN